MGVGVAEGLGLAVVGDGAVTLGGWTGSGVTAALALGPVVGWAAVGSRVAIRVGLGKAKAGGLGTGDPPADPSTEPAGEGRAEGVAPVAGPPAGCAVWNAP